MTIDKRNEITIPMPFLSVGLSMITAVLITWGIISSLRVQAETNKNNIEIMRKEKIDRNEFNQVIQKLDNIEKKLDTHILK
jgi:hypothetical protein